MKTPTLPTIDSTNGMNLKIAQLSDSEHIRKSLTASLSQMYGDPMAAIVREYSANMLDAHAKAGINKKAIICLPTKEDATISFTSYLGLSADELTKYILTYGNSDKRDSNEARGYWGYGAKSLLAHSTSGTFETVKDGIKTISTLMLTDEGVAYSEPITLPTVEDDYFRVTVPTDKPAKMWLERITPLLYTLPKDSIEIIDSTKDHDFRHLSDEIIMLTDSLGFTVFKDSIIPETSLITGGIAYTIKFNKAAKKLQNLIYELYQDVPFYTASKRITLLVFAPIGAVSLPPHRDHLIDDETTAKFINGVIDEATEKLFDRLRKESFALNPQGFVKTGTDYFVEHEKILNIKPSFEEVLKISIPDDIFEEMKVLPHDEKNRTYGTILHSTASKGYRNGYYNTNMLTRRLSAHSYFNDLKSAAIQNVFDSESYRRQRRLIWITETNAPTVDQKKLLGHYFEKIMTVKNQSNPEFLIICSKRDELPLLGSTSSYECFDTIEDFIDAENIHQKFENIRQKEVSQGQLNAHLYTIDNGAADEIYRPSLDDFSSYPIVRLYWDGGHAIANEHMVIEHFETNQNIAMLYLYDPDYLEPLMAKLKDLNPEIDCAALMEVTDDLYQPQKRIMNLKPEAKQRLIDHVFIYDRLGDRFFGDRPIELPQKMRGKILDLVQELKDAAEVVYRNRFIVSWNEHPLYLPEMPQPSFYQKVKARDQRFLLSLLGSEIYNNEINKILSTTYH